MDGCYGDHMYLISTSFLSLISRLAIWQLGLVWFASKSQVTRTGLPQEVGLKQGVDGCYGGHIGLVRIWLSSHLHSHVLSTCHMPASFPGVMVPPPSSRSQDRRGHLLWRSYCSHYRGGCTFITISTLFWRHRTSAPVPKVMIPIPCFP